MKTDYGHVAIFAFPFGSHPAQVLNLMRSLASAAPNVTFSFFCTQQGILSHFKSNSCDNIKAYVIEDGIPENHVPSGKWNHPVEEIIDLFLKAAPENFRKGMEMAVTETNKKISCIMFDAFVWFTGEIAEELKVPWIPIYASGAASLQSHCYTDLIRQNIDMEIDGWKEKRLEFIPGMSAVHGKDLAVEIIGRPDSLFAILLQRMGDMLARANAIAINSFNDLENIAFDNLRSKFRLLLPVGPLSLLSQFGCPTGSVEEDPTGCLSWLESQKPASVAYISFGTFAALPPHELKGIAEGLEASCTPFIWSLKDEFKANLPDGFLDRTRGKGMVIPWTPQIKILQHSSVGVTMTHCGWNSVLECIAYGVPIFFRPVIGDHKLIGRLVSDVWEIGIMADNEVFTREGVINSLDLIFSKDQGLKMREKAEKLKGLVSEALGPNGSTSKNFNTLLGLVTDNF